MTRLRTRLARGAAVAATCLAASGCVRLNQPAPRVQDYTISYPAPAQEAHDPLPVVLQIPPFAVSAAYDSHGIMYREGEHRIDRYVHDRWAANPGNLVADSIARDLAESGIFSAVQHARAPLTSDYRLVGEVETIEEVVGSDGCHANLQIRVLLVSLRAVADDAVVFRRGYTESVPCTCDDATSVARGISTALQRISSALRSDIREAVAADRAD